ncbi:unnamed protein product [Cylindrotheca closterium]|uniref:Uncharacterized protein n=1 Tax=Cylindrotheca closterium TaxID=2856 RepID=A0AAD2CUG9_9STRA|nr:unnamed protein product [Cylindrotheca closterium]
MPVLSNFSIPRKSTGAESENLIPLIPPSPTDEEENQDLLREFTCKRNPDQKRSATYTLKIPPLKNPKPEKLFEILELVEEAWKGQVIVTAEDWSHFLKQLMGESKRTTFRNALPNDGTITDANLERAINILKKTIFPQNAVRLQKKALRGKGFCKRLDMSVREHVSILQTINRLISQFPPGNAYKNAAFDFHNLDLILPRQLESRIHRFICFVFAAPQKETQDHDVNPYSPY